MASVIYQGTVLGQVLRVVDIGAGHDPRIVVEQQQGPDAMGVQGWSLYDPIPRAAFQALLIQSGVIT